jgi:hypothetical protein
MLLLRWLRVCAVSVLASVSCATWAVAGPIQPLTIHGQNFVDPAGNAVRFWGVNLIAFYPDHAKADALAADMASREINLVRPHHLLRPGLDWNPNMVSGALVTYKDNSRTFDKEALDRFDYLNAAFRRKGIYLSFSVNWTRRYLPGDVDIMRTSDADKAEWMAAMKELNGWPWQKGFDVYKMLPTVDERAARLNEEFVRNLLTHVNPYTGKAYANEAQVLTFEVMNEASTEYSVICGNHFPAYWDRKLTEKWHAYAAKAGINGGDLYKPANAKVKAVRAAFLRKLDADYFERIKAVVRGTGCKTPMMFSNLWRGDNALAMHAEHADVIENHAYSDPLVVRKAEDVITWLSASALVNKPFFVGELNEGEGSANIRKQAPDRTMLPLAISAYGSLQNWTGIEWFAWAHGNQKPLGADGWAADEGREANIGQMMNDGMMIDHLRTTGIIFRRGLVARSSSPITMHVDEPLTTGNYQELMRGKYVYKPGWQDIHGVRKAFGPVPAGQATADWMTQAPASPLVSDTGQITKDISRQQLTVAAPQAEAFSGFLDGQPPAELKHLAIDGEGFATVVIVADDGTNVGDSVHLIISRTNLDKANSEVDGPTIRLKGMKRPSGKQQWSIKMTRPRDLAGAGEVRPLQISGDGQLTLPNGGWHECELELK